MLAADVGIGYVQLTHEFINPAWPAPLVRRLTDRMAQACAAEKLHVTSMMTGPYGRLNHFGHPDADVRRYYVHWFKRLADIAADLGCPSIGTQFAILTYRDFDDEGRRKAIMDVAIEEMGHLLIVANLTVAVGGRAHFARPNFPVSPGYFPSGVVVRLSAFSMETLDHFIFLERPQGVAGGDSETYEQASYDRDQAIILVMP